MIPGRSVFAFIIFLLENLIGLSMVKTAPYIRVFAGKTLTHTTFYSKTTLTHGYYFKKIIF
jgi:hypothetical protein